MSEYLRVHNNDDDSNMRAIECDRFYCKQMLQATSCDVVSVITVLLGRFKAVEKSIASTTTEGSAARR